MSKNWPSRPAVSGNHIRDLAAAARLNLKADRAEILVPQVQMVYGLLDALTEVQVGETAPAFAFSPRWKE
jgi:Asp-tRNA(Asn)/Glu-tRNA(Gln) amidotransferase C subunit